jgi:hypothetical protein
METEKGEVINLQVGSHDNVEVSPFWDLRFKEFGVGNGLLRRVDGAGADDDENSIVVA